MAVVTLWRKYYRDRRSSPFTDHEQGDDRRDYPAPVETAPPSLPADVRAAIADLPPDQAAAVDRVLSSGGSVRHTGPGYERAVRSLRRRLGGMVRRCRAVPVYRSRTLPSGRMQAFCSANERPIYLGCGDQTSRDRFRLVCEDVAAGRPVREFKQYTHGAPIYQQIGKRRRHPHARMRIAGKPVHLGRYGTPESIAMYHRLIREHGLKPHPAAPPAPTGA